MYIVQSIKLEVFFYIVVMMIMNYCNSRTFKDLFTSNSKTFKALFCLRVLSRSWKMDTFFSMSFKVVWPPCFVTACDLVKSYAFSFKITVEIIHSLIC